MQKRFASALFAVTFFVAAGCSPTVATRGNMISDTTFAKVTAQTSTRADVTNAWGPPTAVSSFDQNTWYYIGEKTSQKGIFAPEVEKRRIIRIRFNPEDNDTVIEVAEVDPQHARNIDIATRTTPTAGKDFTVLQQLIGNIGKYNPDAKK